MSVSNPTLHDMLPLGRAREIVQQKIDGGIICPCCGQLARKSKTPLDRSTAKMLTFMYQQHYTKGIEWLHSTDLHPISGNYTKPKFWGLIEEKSHDSEQRVVEGEVKASGYWRLTGKGKMFVEGKLCIQEKAILFNQQYFGFWGKNVFISDCLKRPFNYTELMEG